MTLVTPVIQSAGPSGSCRPFYTHHRDHERHSHWHHHGTQVPVLLLRAPTGRTALPVGAGDAKSEFEGFCDHKSQVWVWQRPTGPLQLVSMEVSQEPPSAPTAPASGE